MSNNKINQSSKVSDKENIITYIKSITTIQSNLKEAFLFDTYYTPYVFFNIENFNIKNKSKKRLNENIKITKNDYKILSLLLKNPFQIENLFINIFYNNYEKNLLFQTFFFANCYNILLNRIENLYSNDFLFSTKDFFHIICLICSDFPKEINDKINFIFNFCSCKCDMKSENDSQIDNQSLIEKEHYEELNGDLFREVNISNIKHYFWFYLSCYFNINLFTDFLLMFNISISKGNTINKSILITYSNILESINKFESADSSQKDQYTYLFISTLLYIDKEIYDYIDKSLIFKSINNVIEIIKEKFSNKKVFLCVFIKSMIMNKECVKGLLLINDSTVEYIINTLESYIYLFFINSYRIHIYYIGSLILFKLIFLISSYI